MVRMRPAAFSHSFASTQPCGLLSEIDWQEDDMTFCSDQADSSVWKRMQTGAQGWSHPTSANAANRHSSARLSHPVAPSSGANAKPADWKRLLANRECAGLAQEVTKAFFSHAGRDWAHALLADRQAVIAASALSRPVSRAGKPSAQRWTRSVLGELKPVLAHSGDGMASAARTQLPAAAPGLAKAA
jgi:hypothetical protein